MQTQILFLFNNFNLDPPGVHWKSMPGLISLVGVWRHIPKKAGANHVNKISPWPRTLTTKIHSAG